MTISDVQTALRDAALNVIGPAFGLGGSSWVVTRPSGNGVTTDRTLTTVGTVTAYVKRSLKTRLAGNDAQTLVPTTEWHVIAPLASALVVGDVLTSAEYQVTLMGAIHVVGYLRFVAEVESL